MSWPCVCLPGCERLEPVGENTYRAVLNMTIAAISGNYEGTAAIVDQPPPRAYKIPIDGQGRSGFVKGEAGVALTEESGNSEAQRLKRIASSQGMKDTALLRQWIVERLHDVSAIGRPHNKPTRSAAKARRVPSARKKSASLGAADRQSR